MNTGASHVTDTDWDDVLGEHFRAPGFARLREFVEDERRHHLVHPADHEVFAAFRATAHAATQVLILGQDPYHGPGQATGLAFSVRRGCAVPPSLRNVFIERHGDIGLAPPAHGDLSPWAARGVLLMNATLTVRDGLPGSHRDAGWELLTDAVIRAVATKTDHVVFALWGSFARAKRRLIDDADPRGRHTVIESAHPSPLSARRGFFGSRPFSRANAARRAHGQEPIDWSLPD